MNAPDSHAPSICRYLRTKKLFIPEQASRAWPDESSPPANDPHCWCNATMTELGPDDRPASARTCHPGRACYRE